MEELKQRLESAKAFLQSVVDERPAASVSRILEAEQAVKVAEEALAEASRVEEVKEVKKPKTKKGVN